MNPLTPTILLLVLVLLPVAVSFADDSQRVRDRSEIDTKYLWATERIFPDAKAWEEAFATVEKGIPALVASKGTLAKNADALLKALKLRDALEPELEKVYVYASLLSDQDTRDGTTQGMKARVFSMYVNYSEAMSWFTPELTSMPFETIDSWMRENPDLAMYRQYMDDAFRQKKYVLSAREEELMAMAGEIRNTAGKAYNLLSNADLKFPTITDEEGNTVELDDSAFYKYMRSTDRRVRKDAYQAIVGTYAKYRNTAAALLNGAVQSHIFNVKARGYDSCLQASLFGSAVPTEVYKTLVSTVNDNLALLHRYQDIRKRVLKLEDGVQAYDLFAPLVEEQDIHYEYEDAVEQIADALQPLGDEYLATMAKGFNSRWVDVYPTKGKRSGAYSSGTYLTEPFMLMNFHGTYEDTSTLAHEMGHSMHSYLSHANQPYVYGDYDIFCAEVASTCNEIIFQNYVMDRTTDPKKKLYLLVEFLEGFRGTVFRQTMFSEFEQHIHEMAEAGQPLTADAMGAAYGEIMKRYYGPSYTHEELVDNYWIRIPHFYYNFYVYKYATSYCAATNIASRIQAEEPGAVDAYLSFLKGGSHKYPVDLLKGARVDMTSPKPYQDAMKLFEAMLDQTEQVLKELGS